MTYRFVVIWTHVGDKCDWSCVVQLSCVIDDLSAKKIYIYKLITTIVNDLSTKIKKKKMYC